MPPNKPLLFPLSSILTQHSPPTPLFLLRVLAAQSKFPCQALKGGGGREGAEWDGEGDGVGRLGLGGGRVNRAHAHCILSHFHQRGSIWTCASCTNPKRHKLELSLWQGEKAPLPEETFHLLHSLMGWSTSRVGAAALEQENLFWIGLLAY